MAGFFSPFFRPFFRPYPGFIGFIGFNVPDFSQAAANQSPAGGHPPAEGFCG